MAIILRNDDVLLPSPTRKNVGREHDRFQFVHKMCLQTKGRLIHRPTVLCKEIEQFPDTISYIRERIDEMQVELHCWDHVDYVHKSKVDITDMLKKCQDWFDKKFNQQFTSWYTPWGGDTMLAREVCSDLNITLESTAGTLGVGQCVEYLMQNGNLKPLENQILLFHWWQRGNNFGRLAEILKHGSYEAAKAVDERGWF